jgi:hypothetical protein
MGIKNRIASQRPQRSLDNLTEKLYREERNYRLDKLVEKWSGVAEIGKGIENMLHRQQETLLHSLRTRQELCQE